MFDHLVTFFTVQQCKNDKIFVAANLLLGQFCIKKFFFNVCWVYYIVFWFDAKMHNDQKDDFLMFIVLRNSKAPKLLY